MEKGKIHSSMATIGLVIREEIMGTFFGIVILVFCTFVSFYATYKTGERRYEAIKKVEKMEEQLCAMEMRMNALLERLEDEE